ncbi:MAG: hypothetical protein AAGF11_37510 [Myxococcota bacterium]
MMHVALDANPRPTSEPTNTPPTLFRHCRREDWGLAIVVWEHDGKRGYRFEGGDERTFKEGYYHLFKPQAAVGDAAERLLASLASESAADPAVGSAVDPAAARRARRAAMPTLTELVAVFREEYPGGFGDPRWAQRVRGEGSSRRAKRHREAAIAEASTLLDKQALDGLLAEGDAAEVVRRAIAVVAATDLVTKAQLEALRSMTPTIPLASALRDLVHEPDVDGVHFDRLAGMLARAPRGKPSWPLLTALRALSDPKGDVYVRPTVFRAMAEIVTPSLSRRVRPHGGYYNRCVAMVRDLREQLATLGEPARDLLDVSDFIWTVCRPAAAKVLARVRQRAASVEAPVEAPVETSVESSGAEAPVEAGPVEAGPVEAGPVEAGPVEAGPVEAAPVEAAEVEAGDAALVNEAA